jgi:RNAse (barnase) inhibitor barstar
MKTYLEVTVEEIEEFKKEIVEKIDLLEISPEDWEKEIDTLWDIFGECANFIYYRPLVGTQADKDTFGEFSRRAERAYQEIDKLVEGI